MAKVVAMDLLPGGMEESLLPEVMEQSLPLVVMEQSLPLVVMEESPVSSNSLLKVMGILNKVIHLSKGSRKRVMVLNPVSLVRILDSLFLRARERTPQWLQDNFLRAHIPQWHRANFPRAQEHIPQWGQDNFLSQVNFLNQVNILNQVSQVNTLNQASQAHIQVNQAHTQANRAHILKVLELPQAAFLNQAMEALKAPAHKQVLLLPVNQV